MKLNLNFRLLIAAVLVAGLGAWVLAREHRPSLLQPDLRLYAYVANAGDGTLTVVDLAALRTVGAISVGPAPNGLRIRPDGKSLALGFETARDEIWGVSTAGGYVWVVDAPTSQVVARIHVGAGAFGLDFSPVGARAYVAASRAGTVSMLDCDARRVVATVRTGHEPWSARVTPDGKMLVVANRGANTLTLLDALTLKQLATIGVAGQPEHVLILPDGAKAFVSAPASGQVSIVDLRRRVLLTNLVLNANVTDFTLKLSDGEIYAATPGLNGIAILDSWTNEVKENLVVGNRPAHGTLGTDGTLYLSDAASGQVRPVGTRFRRVQTPIPAGRRPGASALTPGEDLLLVVNEESNDLAVIRTRTQSLLTLIPVGLEPRDLVVKLFRQE
ncbi:MAG: cytochrome D1 domain-containing protein [Candidatus Acidiferrales bacterium]